jgi:hypothetical protein
MKRSRSLSGRGKPTAREPKTVPAQSGVVRLQDFDQRGLVHGAHSATVRAERRARRFSGYQWMAARAMIGAGIAVSASCRRLQRTNECRIIAPRRSNRCPSSSALVHHLRTRHNGLRLFRRPGHGDCFCSPQIVESDARHGMLER